MKIKITKTILNAIMEAVNESGSQMLFARKCNIDNKSQISQYLSRKTTTMQSNTWRNVYPIIKKFLPEDFNHQTKDEYVRPIPTPVNNINEFIKGIENNIDQLIEQNKKLMARNKELEEEIKKLKTK